MKIWTVHTRPDAAPVLVREACSWGGFLFGPLWLLAQRAWIPAVLLFCAWLATGVAPAPLRGVLALGLAWLTGLFGRDMVRWSLARRGFLLAHVLAARTEDEALARLLDRRPDLLGDLMPERTAEGLA